MLRLFIAFPVPAPIRERLAGVQQTWAGARRAVRWARVDGLHLTLLFLGPREAADVPALEGAMRHAVAGHGPLRLVVQGLGGFPTLSRPRVLWAGVDGDLAMLGAVQGALEREVHRAGIPFERQPFRPHITLGRAKGPPVLVDVAGVGQDDAMTFGAWAATAMHLVRSELRPGGSVYTTIFRASLRAEVPS